ncbi:MAG: di-trans,poly-cis-decaprenylcistransferase [Lentisphaerae bacterium]|nr:di-trans,poly-cis-decaprenylcistransferase [Lentisphaerota bacterium]
MAESTDSSNVPRHIAFIMDGNGRWAKARGLPRLKGHEAGAETVRLVIRCCRDWGVRYLTLYAFSTENWRRPALEVNGLMRLLQKFLQENEGGLHEHGVRLRVIGRRGDLPGSVRREVERVEAATVNYDSGELILALSYGGRVEIAEAARRIAEKVAKGELKPGAVNEKVVTDHLYAPDVPDPDLVVRTSGEFRTSNFLPWQSVYSEWLITPVLWPDFSESDFQAVIEAYTRRNRRFGGVESGVTKESNG